MRGQEPGDAIRLALGSRQPLRQPLSDSCAALVLIDAWTGFIDRFQLPHQDHGWLGTLVRLREGQRRLVLRERGEVVIVSSQWHRSLLGMEPDPVLKDVVIEVATARL